MVNELVTATLYPAVNVQLMFPAVPAFNSSRQQEGCLQTQVRSWLRTMLSQQIQSLQEALTPAGRDRSSLGLMAAKAATTTSQGRLPAPRDELLAQLGQPARTPEAHWGTLLDHGISRMSPPGRWERAQTTLG